MNRKFLALALVLGFSAALGACAESTTTPPAATTPAPAATTPAPAATTPAAPSPATTPAPKTTP